MGTDEGREAALCHKAVMMMMMVAWWRAHLQACRGGISYTALQTNVVIKRWSWAQPQWELHHLTEEEELLIVHISVSEDETNTKISNRLSWRLMCHVYKFTALTRTQTVYKRWSTHQSHFGPSRLSCSVGAEVTFSHSSVCTSLIPLLVFKSHTKSDFLIKVIFLITLIKKYKLLKLSASAINCKANHII